MNKLFRISGIAVLATAILFACDKAEKLGDGFYIKGELKNSDKGYVYLEEFVDRQYRKVDSTAIGPDKKFYFKGKVEEKSFYRINLFNQQSIYLIVDNGLVDITEMPGGTFEVNAGIDNEYMKLGNRMDEEYNSATQNMNAGMQQAMQSGDTAQMHHIYDQFNALEAEFAMKRKRFVDSIGVSPYALIFAASNIDFEEEMPYMESLLAKFKKDAPKSKYTKEFERIIAEYKAVNVGGTVPDFELQSITGDRVKLSSFKGKVLLLDFWASWCKPCREENPSVVKAYAKYHKKGLEILGVSLDNEKMAWEAAIKKDGITWQQVSDGLGWDSPVVSLYHVTAIPATFLIDKNGIVVAKDLRGEKLAAKIEELLKK